MPDFTGGRRTTSSMERLLLQFEEQFKTYRGWRFEYEYPGYLVYYHPSRTVSVYFTPDFDKADEVSIQVMSGDGTQVLEVAGVPFVIRTAENLFQAVRPWLEKYE